MVPGREEVTVGDRTYYIKRMDPFLALEVLGDLQKHFLAPVVTALEAIKGKKVEGGVDSTEADKTAMLAVTDAIQKLSHGMDGKTLVALTKLVLKPDYVSVRGGDSNVVRLDERAAAVSFGDVGEIVELVIHVVRVNYERVFTAGLTRIGSALKQRIASQSVGLATS